MTTTEGQIWPDAEASTKSAPTLDSNDNDAKPLVARGRCKAAEAARPSWTAEAKRGRARHRAVELAHRHLRQSDEQQSTAARRRRPEPGRRDERGAQASRHLCKL